MDRLDSIVREMKVKDDRVEQLEKDNDKLIRLEELWIILKTEKIIRYHQNSQSIK